MANHWKKRVETMLSKRLAFKGKEKKRLSQERTGQRSVSLRQVCLKLKEGIYQIRYKQEGIIGEASFQSKQEEM